jgi:hypothetical protein
LIPEEIKPGSRDYAWTVDTISIFSNNFMSIWGSSPEDMWGVGPGGALNITIWHFDGKKWTTDYKSRSISPYCIYGFAKNDIWMAGMNGKIWHYDGNSWSETQPAGNKNARWKAASMSSDGTKMIAGIFGGRLYLYKNELSVDVKDKYQLPLVYNLSQNYPNPFNPVTTINYQLPKDGNVTLKIYDILGREVAALVNEFKQAGYYKAAFNASKLASGVYIYELRVNEFRAVKKLTLLK